MSITEYSDGIEDIPDGAVLAKPDKDITDNDESMLGDDI